jgi:EpsI family protein
MTRQARFSVAALVLIGAAAILLAISGRPARAVSPAWLAGFPATIAGWTATDAAPGAILPADSRAARHLSRTYEHGGRPIWVAVDYYPDQGQNQRPAARQLVFPGHGWADLSEQQVRIPLDGGSGQLPATLVLMRTADRTVAVLYWYQLQDRSVASDHWYRALLIWNRIVHGRGDGALVRVASAVPETSTPSEVLGQLGEFIRAFHADLLAALPR